MPFDRPDLDAIRLRIKQDIRNRLPGTDPLLRHNNLSIIGEVQAGAAHLLYGRLDWMFRQLFPDTAEGPFLERWAGIWGVPRREATRAGGTATWPANPNTAIATGGTALRGDGLRYEIVQGASVVRGFITVQVAAEDFGAAGNSIANVQLTLATTANGVAPLGRVDPPGIAGGANAETDELLLQRLLARVRLPPRGGAAHDYIRWAMEMPGVTRAWVYPLEQGPGTVVVRFMMDDVRASEQGIPTAADVALVQAHIDLVRPITAGAVVVAPIPAPLDLVIAQLEPDTPEVRANIDTELRYLLRRETAPGEELYQSQLFAAINAAPGVTRFRLVEPSSDVEASPGEIITLGQVDYV